MGIFSIAQKFIWNSFISNGFENKIIDRDDAIIQFWDNNMDAPVVMLIHGFGASAEFQWYKQIKALAKNYRVIVPNLYYFGDTKPTASNKYNLQDQVDLIYAVLQNIQQTSCHLIGISYGGLVAAEYTRQYSNTVNRLILIDAPIKYFTVQDMENVCKTYKLSTIEDLFAPKDYKGLQLQFKAAYYKKQLIPGFIYNILYQQLCKPNINNWQQLMQHLKEQLHFYANQNYTFKNQTLLIWGDKDDIIPVRISSELQAHLYNSEVNIIKKAKHLPNLEKPKLVNKLIIDFLKK